MVDTFFVFTNQDIQQLSAILMESKLIVKGEQLTGKQLSELFNWIQSKGKLIPNKEQPKK
jgi:hypothetical protein